MTSMNQYQAIARGTAIYPREYAKTYPLIGLSGEVGEFCNKYKKVLRDGTPLNLDDVQAELGDILWYLSNLAADFGLPLDEIAEHNLEKLQSRQDRGVLGGSGDNR